MTFHFAAKFVRSGPYWWSKPHRLFFRPMRVRSMVDMTKPISLRSPTERIQSLLPKMAKNEENKEEKKEEKKEENKEENKVENKEENMDNTDIFSFYQYLSLIGFGVIIGVWLWKK